MQKNQKLNFHFQHVDPSSSFQVGTLTVQLETNITMCICYSSFGRAGEGRNILAARGQGKLLFPKLLFPNLLFLPHVPGQACAGCMQLLWVLFLARSPSSADVELQWLDAPLEMWQQQPRAQTHCPLSAVPSQSCQKPNECFSCPVHWLQGM